MTFVPFCQAEAVGDRFLALLSRLHIKPPSRSSVEHELLSLTDLVEVMRDPNRATGSNQAEVLRQAAGLHDLAAKVLSAEGLLEFETFKPHLKLLGENAESFSTLIQNARAALPNDTNRKLTELYIASLAIHLANSIELDSPNAAKGNNPDILFSYVGDPCKGRRWALAIKSVSGESGQTYFERIQEAARQIDAAVCPADIGMVVINLKDTLDHDALWRTPFPDLQSATKALCQEIQERMNKVEAERPQTEWDALFEGKVVRPILFMAHTLVRITAPGGLKIPTALKAMVAFGAKGAPHPVGYEITVGLNDIMQRVLAGAPGSPGRLPH
jgi:hypothetical protein